MISQERLDAVVRLLEESPGWTKTSDLSEIFETPISTLRQALADREDVITGRNGVQALIHATAEETESFLANLYSRAREIRKRADRMAEAIARLNQ